MLGGSGRPVFHMLKEAIMEDKTMSRPRLFALIAAMLAAVVCMGFASPAQAAETTAEETQATYTVTTLDDGVLLDVQNATLKANDDGTVDILSTTGQNLETLPTEYEGIHLYYHIISDTELAAAGYPDNTSPYVMLFDGNKYVQCIAGGTLANAARGGIQTGLAGGGVAGAVAGALVSGLIVAPLACLIGQ